MRVTNSPVTRKRHKKVLDQTKGYKHSRRNRFRSAKETLERGLVYAYRDRKVRKRDFRRLWIQRINAAAREQGLTYGRFIDGLNKAGITINRKMLAELAVNQPEAFSSLVQRAKEAS